MGVLYEYRSVTRESPHVSFCLVVRDTNILWSHRLELYDSGDLQAPQQYKEARSVNHLPALGQYYFPNLITYCIPSIYLFNSIA